MIEPDDQRIRHLVLMQDRTATGGSAYDVEPKPMTGDLIDITRKPLGQPQRHARRRPPVEPERRLLRLVVQIEDRLVAGHIVAPRQGRIDQQAPYSHRSK